MLDNLCKIILELQRMSGTNDKKVLLTREKDNIEFKTLLVYLLDSQYTFGINKIGVGVIAKDTSVSYEEFIKHLEKLNSSDINDKLRHETSVMLGRCNEVTQQILKGIIQKSLKLGITAKTLNEVYKGIIPEHPIALAKSPNEAVTPVPCIVGVKYDGIRYTQIKIEVDDSGNVKSAGFALTRDRNRLKFSNIEKGITELLKGYPGTWVIDGELETLDSDFSKVQGITSSNIDKCEYENNLELKLTVFDLIRYSDYIGETKSLPQAKRLIELSKLFMVNKPKYLEEAKHYTVQSIDKVKELTDMYIKQGLEGTIIKDPNASYKKGKTSAWIKQKAINDCTLKCVGVTISDNNKRAGKVGALMMESIDGLIKVNVGSGLTDSLVNLYTNVPPIGKFFDVLFNVVSQAEDGQMSLRLPRLKGPRIDVTEADSFDKIKSQHIGKMMLMEN